MVDSPPEATTTAAAAADSPRPAALPPNGRAELDATRSAVIAIIIRLTDTADFDLIIILNSDRLTQELT